MMRQVLRFSPDSVRPGRAAVLALQGMSGDIEPDPRLDAYMDKALDILGRLCEPSAVYQMVSVPEFDGVFRGSGLNEARTPLAGIYPRAQAMALFAITLGGPVSRRIAELFEADDFVLGYVLDAAASAAADRCAEAVQEAFGGVLVAAGRVPSSRRTLRYSPGYCGWHLSAQRGLFDLLNPEEIGVTLGKSFLMEPLKSVSGVLVCGEPGIHEFKNAFPFCGRCSHRTCRERH